MKTSFSSYGRFRFILFFFSILYFSHFGVISLLFPSHLSFPFLFILHNTPSVFSFRLQSVSERQKVGVYLNFFLSMTGSVLAWRTGVFIS